MPDGSNRYHAMEAVRESEREWETIRWPGQTGKMLFHPRPDRPTEPNAGIVRYEPGSHHPRHNHDFAQVWYILEGEFEKLKGCVGNKEGGCQSFDQHLTELFMKQMIDVKEAERLASNVDALKLALRGIGNSDTRLR